MATVTTISGEPLPAVSELHPHHDHDHGIETKLRDAEKAQHYQHEDKDPYAPQLNVGGHGGTQRRLKNYQVTMIGITSGIGTGLFIGTGAAYAKAGPAGLLLSFIVVGGVLWCVMQSIAELATLVCVLASLLIYTCTRSSSDQTIHITDPHGWFFPSLGHEIHRPGGRLFARYLLRLLLHHRHRL